MPVRHRRTTEVRRSGPLLRRTAFARRVRVRIIDALRDALVVNTHRRVCAEHAAELVHITKRVPYPEGCSIS